MVAQFSLEVSPFLASKLIYSKKRGGRKNACGRLSRPEDRALFGLEGAKDII